MNQSESLSAKSCVDFNLSSSLEAEFLEKYFHDVLMDQCATFLTPTIYRTLLTNQKAIIIQRYIQEQRDLQQQQKVHFKMFFTKSNFPISVLSQHFRKIMNNLELLSNNNSTASKSSGRVKGDNLDEFLELYENKYLQRNQILNQGELVYIDTRLKITNSRMKLQLQNVKSHLYRLLQQPNHFLVGDSMENFQETFFNYYDKKTITVVLFVNGDINFDFEKYNQSEEIKIGQNRFHIRLKIYYVSYNKIYNSFQSNNGLQYDQLNERIMAFYELKRYGQLKININDTLVELNKLQNQSKKQIFNYLYLGIAIVAITFVGITFGRKNKNIQ